MVGRFTFRRRPSSEELAHVSDPTRAGRALNGWKADVDRVMTFMERVWRRMLEAMGNVQKDMQGKT
jgi:hypothetical protein